MVVKLSVFTAVLVTSSFFLSLNEWNVSLGSTCRSHTDPSWCLPSFTEFLLFYPRKAFLASATAPAAAAAKKRGRRPRELASLQAAPLDHDADAGGGGATKRQSSRIAKLREKEDEERRKAEAERLQRLKEEHERRERRRLERDERMKRLTEKQQRRQEKSSKYGPIDQLWKLNVSSSIENWSRFNRLIFHSFSIICHGDHFLRHI